MKYFLQQLSVLVIYVLIYYARQTSVMFCLLYIDYMNTEVNLILHVMSSIQSNTENVPPPPVLHLIDI